MNLRILPMLSALFALIFPVASASAHPHVWVTMKSEVVYAPDGSITGIRHAWTFDDMFSTFALQGLESKEKDKYTRAELDPLAEVNVTSLKEYDFFTEATADGKKVKFEEPKKGEYWLTFDDSMLTLHFTLGIAQPLKSKTFSFQVADPTYFVDFGLAKEKPVALAGAPAGCKLSIVPPKDTSVAAGQPLSESFFNQLAAAASSGNYGAQFASKISVTCP